MLLLWRIILSIPKVRAHWCCNGIETAGRSTLFGEFRKALPRRPFLLLPTGLIPGDGRMIF